MCARSATGSMSRRSAGAHSEQGDGAALETELAALGTLRMPLIDEAAVARRVADWRGPLRRGPVLARQILRKILPGVRPLALAPMEGGGVAFTGYAASASILAGLAMSLWWCPRGDSNTRHAV